MGIAEASQSRLAYVVETVIGTTPATPSFQTLRYTSESIRRDKRTVTSDEVRGDGNVPAPVDVGASVSGNINAELSYGTFDVFFESLFRSAWATNVLKNGITPKGVTLEKTLETGTTDSFLRYRGCKIGSLDLDITAREIVKANWGVMGIDNPAGTTSPISGATYAAATTTPPLNATQNVAALAIGGITGSPKVRSVQLRFQNEMYDNDVVGQYAPDSQGQGRFLVTGSIDTYFEDLNLYNAIVGHDDVTLSITIGAASGAKYTISVPKIKLASGAPVIGGNNQAVRLQPDISAYYDSSSAATCTITRAVA